MKEAQTTPKMIDKNGKRELEQLWPTWRVSSSQRTRWNSLADFIGCFAGSRIGNLIRRSTTIPSR